MSSLWQRKNIHVLTSYPAGERREHEKFCCHELKVVYCLIFRGFNVKNSKREEIVQSGPRLSFPLSLEFRCLRRIRADVGLHVSTWTRAQLPAPPPPPLEWVYTSSGWWEERQRAMCPQAQPSAVPTTAFPLPHFLPVIHLFFFSFKGNCVVI